jgi:hypothetical protein
MVAANVANKIIEQEPPAPPPAAEVLPAIKVVKMPTTT